MMEANGHWGTHDRALREHAELVEPILERIRAGGPLGSRDFEGGGSGGMWNWKPAKMVLDALWDRGELVIAGRRSFQRLYDLAERVIPKQLLEAPTPTEAETLRDVRAARRRGARRPDRGGDPRALAARGRQERGSTTTCWRSSTRALLREIDADDGGAPFYVPAGRRARRARRRRRCSSARSTTSSGTGRSSSACSASAT